MIPKTGNPIQGADCFVDGDRQGSSDNNGEVPTKEKLTLLRNYSIRAQHPDYIEAVETTNPAAIKHGQFICRLNPKPEEVLHNVGDEVDLDTGSSSQDQSGDLDGAFDNSNESSKKPNMVLITVILTVVLISAAIILYLNFQQKNKADETARQRDFTEIERCVKSAGNLNDIKNCKAKIDEYRGKYKDNQNESSLSNFESDLDARESSLKEKEGLLKKLDEIQIYANGIASDRIEEYSDHLKGLSNSDAELLASEKFNSLKDQNNNAVELDFVKLKDRLLDRFELLTKMNRLKNEFVETKKDTGDLEKNRANRTKNREVKEDAKKILNKNAVLSQKQIRHYKSHFEIN